MAPIKSEAQRRRLYKLAAEGKMSKEKVAQWESETPKDRPLPERLGFKKIPAGPKVTVRRAIKVTKK